MPNHYRRVGDLSDNKYWFEDEPGEGYELVAEDLSAPEEDPVEVPDPVELVTRTSPTDPPQEA